jgi:hypothetical protein
MAAIKISLVADVRSFVSGFRKGTEAVEDVTDELEDLAKEGDQTARSIVDNYEDIARAAKEAQKASAKIGDGADDSIHRVTRTTGEFKDEAKQNFGEVASSFSGDMSSAADLVQGTLGGLASSLSGPLGLALGAASIALGLFIADAQAAAEKAEDLRIKAVDAVAAALDAGIDPTVFLETADQVKETIRDLEKTKANPKRWFWEEDPSQLEEWVDGLKAIGRPTSDIQKVLASSTPILKQYTKAVEDQVKVLDDRRNAAVQAHNEVQNEDTTAAQAAAIAELEAGKDVLKNLQAQIDLRDRVATSADRQAQAGMDAALDAVQAAEDEKASIEELSSAWQNAAVDAADYWVTNEEGVSSFSWDAYLADAEIASANADEFKRRIVTMPPEIAAEGTRLFASQGAAAANAYFTAFETSGAEGQARAIAVATVNGEAYGETQATAVVTGFAAPVLTATVETDTAPAKGVLDTFLSSTANLKPKTTVQADVTKAQTAIEKVADKKYEATIQVKPVGIADANAAITEAARPRQATINARADVTQAQRDLDSFVWNNTGRRVTIYADVKVGTREPV